MLGLGLNLGLGIGGGGAPAGATPLTMSYVRLTRLESDYLTATSITGFASDLTAFTFFWRGRFPTRTTLTIPIFTGYYLDGLGATSLPIRITRYNEAAGYKLQIVGQTAVPAACWTNILSTNIFDYADGYISLLISGTMGGTVRMYVGEDSEGSANWTGGAINTSLAQEWHIGLESTVGTRVADIDTGIVWLDATYRDISQASNRRLFYALDGSPVVPPTGIIDVRGPAATFPTNLGTGGNCFTLTGRLADVPSTYSHRTVTFNGTSNRLSRTTNLDGAVDGGYMTFAAKFNLNSTTLSRLLVATSGVILFVNKLASGDITFSVLDSTSSFGLSTPVTVASGLTSLTTDYTVMVSASKAGVVRCWVNGTETAESIAVIPWDLGLGDIDFSNAATDWYVGSTIASGYINADVGFVYFAAGATSAYYVTDPTIFYNAGDVDLGCDGRLSGAPNPLIFFGGRQEAADWNAGINLGNDGTVTAYGGNFTMNGTVT